MKRRKQLEKWGGVALAVLCVFLVFRLVKEILGNPVPAASPETTTSSPAPKPAQPSRSAEKKGSSAAASDSTLQFRTLDKYVPKPFPDVGRNPFDFGAAPLTPAQKAMQAGGAGGAMTASSGPPPMQIALRAIGYSERPYGPEAYLADAQDVYVVHNGDVVSHRYKVLRITTNIVEVQDGTTGEKAQLPIPQVQ